MARPQVFGRQRRGTLRARDAEFPTTPVPVSSHEKSRDILPRSPQHQHSASHSTRTAPPDRPSTSGGISSRKAVQKLKQETRDDLHFNAHPGHDVSATYFNFQLPDSLPTPSVTPRSSPPPVASPKFSDPEFIESSASPMEIGMALGSPGHQPVEWNARFNYDREQPRLLDSPESMEQAEEWRQAAMQPKIKASKWKRLFGGGKKTAQTQTFYQLQPERVDYVPEPTNLDTHYTTFPSPPSSADRPRTRGGDERPRTRGRTNTVSEKKPKPKPEMKRSQTVPLNFEFQGQKEVLKAPKFDLMKAPEIQLDGGPMLNVDIPRIELERYSVMFGSLIPKPSSNTSSNLLARRQATLDKLKLVNEAIAEHERNERAKLLRPRRATSPQPTKSPAFSLFPTTPNGISARARSSSRSGSPLAPRRSPLAGGSLQRSNTSPAALSPMRQTFALQPAPIRHEYIFKNIDNSNSSNHQIFAHPNTLSTDSLDGQLEHPGEIHTIMLAPTPPLAPTIVPGRVPTTWATDESHLQLDSPSSFVSSPGDMGDLEIRVPLPLKPVLTEPSWEMVPPPVVGVTLTTITAGGGKRRGASEKERARIEDARIASPLSRNPSNAQRTQRGPRGPKGPEEEQKRKPSFSHIKSGSGSGKQSQSQTARPHTSSGSGSRASRRLRSEEDALAAAEASIARQISASQQQRRLLLPIGTRVVVGGGGGSNSTGNTPVSAVHSMTPTLVTIGRRVEGESAVFEGA